MFSFFKFIQNFMQSLRNNKGLWFTILGVSSVVGILLSMYLLISMTKTVSVEVYTNISQTYKKTLKNKIEKREVEFKNLLSLIKTGETFLKNIQDNKLGKINNQINSFNDNFIKAKVNDLSIKFYSSKDQINQYRSSINFVIKNKASNFGIEVLPEGIFLLLIEPIIKNKELLGVLEIKEPLYSLKKDFTKDNGIFLFLLDEKMLKILSPKARNGRYKVIMNNLYVEELRYSSSFYGKILEKGKDGFNQLLDDGYYLDKVYFKTYDKISDINGNIVGYVVLGEVVEGSGAFVNIVNDMTKTVTTVALGLVISILLFMF